jgi:hypothetical protein
MDPVWGWIARLTLAALFAAAGLSKLYRLADFRAAVAAYGLLPARAVALMSVALACAEVIAALLLLLAASRAAGAILLWILLALFSFAIAVNLWRGRTDIDCGCWLFGTGQKAAQGRIGWPMLVRNGVLAALVLIAVLPVSERGLGATDALTIGAGALAAIGLFAMSTQLAVNSRLLAGQKATSP